MKKLLIFLSFLVFVPAVSARVTPNDIYQAKREQFQVSLDKVGDPQQRDKLIQADKLLVQINQNVCNRFDADVLKMSAILTELRSRLNMEGGSTKVAFGQGDNQIEVAEYWLNYAAEAVAYQKIQDYAPTVSVLSSKNSLKGDLGVLRGKILRARSEVKKALDYAK